MLRNLIFVVVMIMLAFTIWFHLSGKELPEFSYDYDYDYEYDYDYYDYDAEVEDIEAEMQALLDELKEEGIDAEIKKLERDFLDPTTVNADTFSLTVPETWALVPDVFDERDESGRYLYGWLEFGPVDYVRGHEDAIEISIEEVTYRNDNTFDSLMATWIVTDANIPPSATATTSNEETQIDGHRAIINDYICQSGCQEKSNQLHQRAYFIDRGNHMLFIRAFTITSEHSQELIDQASEVIETIQLDPNI